MNKKPSIQQRYAIYMGALDLQEFIDDLELAYEQTNNEKVLKVLNKFKLRVKTIKDMEQEFSDDDLQEIRDNPGLYPHSVVTWAFFYRDQEVS